MNTNDYDRDLDLQVSQERIDLIRELTARGVPLTEIGRRVYGDGFGPKMYGLGEEK